MKDSSLLQPKDKSKNGEWRADSKCGKYRIYRQKTSCWRGNHERSVYGFEYVLVNLAIGGIVRGDKEYLLRVISGETKIERWKKIGTDFEYVSE